MSQPLRESLLVRPLVVDVQVIVVEIDLRPGLLQGLHCGPVTFLHSRESHGTLTHRVDDIPLVAPGCRLNVGAVVLTGHGLNMLVMLWIDLIRVPRQDRRHLAEVIVGRVFVLAQLHATQSIRITEAATELLIARITVLVRQRPDVVRENLLLNVLERLRLGPGGRFRDGIRTHARERLLPHRAVRKLHRQQELDR